MILISLITVSSNSIPAYLEFSTVPFAPILFCSKHGNSDMSGFVRSSYGI